METMWLTEGMGGSIDKYEGEIVRIITEHGKFLLRESTSSVGVHIKDGDRWSEVVEVYKPRDWCSSVQPAEVNWSALGSQPTEVARLFAEALQLACALADNANSRLGG